MYLEKLAGSCCYYEYSGVSLVHEAIKNGITLDSELLELLKTLGCKGNMVDIFRHNYLHAYAHREVPTRQIGTFTKLHRIFKCDPNQHAGCGGESVLQLLVKNTYWKSYEEIDELMNIGVDPNILDDESRTVFHHLLCNDNDDMIKQQTVNKLLQIGCKPNDEDIRKYLKMDIVLNFDHKEDEKEEETPMVAWVVKDGYGISTVVFSKGDRLDVATQYQEEMYGCESKELLNLKELHITRKPELDRYSPGPIPKNCYKELLK